ncbi:Predicted hydrolase or acyltransferase [Rickettsia akari str. Hartford]|uniref:Predicted hydrolase or acyltransferase n=1 Tax=Rickettsia akari (strain Hartford) TaxID=293614 RepID=A8GNT0_RICAH|nr:hypothetical protein [Rickettsia akari]ABV75055.1 Predicted hydrolase or acyltransferase [Rickettsia akari str. Hartford]
MINFVSRLYLQGRLFIWYFPGDCNNRNTEEINYEGWKECLIEVVDRLAPCILVTDSFSGMFSLTTDNLANILTGLVIMSCTPNNPWTKETANKYNVSDITNDINELYANTTDDQLKMFFYANITHIFCEHEISVGKQLLELCSYNIKTRIWASQNFYNSYKHRRIPNKLPTLIIGSQDDK